MEKIVYSQVVQVAAEAERHILAAEAVGLQIPVEVAVAEVHRQVTTTVHSLQEVTAALEELLFDMQGAR